MLMPASRFSNSAFTGVRVPRSAYAPLTLPGMLSTAGYCDQSRQFAIVKETITAASGANFHWFT
jgi:hypothetical protein